MTFFNQYTINLNLKYRVGQKLGGDKPTKNVGLSVYAVYLR